MFPRGNHCVSYPPHLHLSSHTAWYEKRTEMQECVRKRNRNCVVRKGFRVLHASEYYTSDNGRRKAVTS